MFGQQRVLQNIDINLIPVARINNKNIYKDIILNKVNQNGQTSVRKLAREIGTSKDTVHRVLKENKYFGYKLHISQKLQLNDYVKRKRMCMWFQNQIARDIMFPFKVMWSDEATFYVNGTFNRHNNRYI